MSFLSPEWRRRQRILIHIPMGFLIVEGAFLHWTIPLTLTALFLFYERDEDHWIQDQAWRDVKGALWGMALALGVRLILWG